jgi:hypothetical protein
VCLVSPVEAHHSPIPFDSSRIIEIQGEVLEFEWQNPHIHVVLGETDSDGDEIHWDVEGQGPSFLTARGFTADTIRVGDQVTFHVNPNRNPASHLVNAMAVTLANGTTIPIHSVVPPEIAELTNLDDDIGRSAESIDGVWVTQNLHARQLLGVAEKEDWQLTERGAEVLAAYATLALHDGAQNPQSQCVAVTAPRTLLLPVVHTIETGDDEVSISSDWMDADRIVYLDGREPPEDELFLHGYSLGSWESETLVVETTNYSPNGAGITLGLPSSERKHLVERFTLGESGTELHYSYVLADPEYLSEPLTGDAYLTYRPDAQPTDIPCDADSASRYLTEG